MKAKKILAVVLALALCVGCVSMIVSATSATTTAAPQNFVAMVEDWNDVAIDKLDAAPGDCVNEATEDGLLDLSCSSGTRIHSKGDLVTFDDETGKITGQKVDGFNLNLATDTVKGIPYASTSSGVAIYLEIGANFKVPAAAAAVADSGFRLILGTMDQDNTVDKAKDFYAAPIDLPAIPADGFKGWVYIPMNTFTGNFWGLGAGTNDYFDLSQIVYFYLDVAGYTTDGEALDFKVGQIGFYGNEFAQEEPLNYTSFVDFTDWADTDLAAYATSGDWGSVVPTVDDDGLLTLTMTNSSYTQYYAPGASLVYTDDETGDVTGALPGVTTSFGEGTGKFVETATTENGICFYVDLSGWTSTSAVDVMVYFNDIDYKEDGTTVKKAGKDVASNWQAVAQVNPGYKGWVTVPFSKMNLVWDSADVNGYVDLATCEWIMLYPNVPAGENVYKIGKIGFYGPAFKVVESSGTSSEGGSTSTGTSTGNTSTGNTSTGGTGNTSTGNVDTGATAASGIASGLAIASLAVVAAVCFRKKND